MGGELMVEDFITLGNDIKDVEKRVMSLAEKAKKLPKRVNRRVFGILKEILKFKIEARHEMMKRYGGDPRCQRCGLDIFEGPDRRVRPTGEIYNIEDNQDS